MVKYFQSCNITKKGLYPPYFFVGFAKFQKTAILPQPVFTCSKLTVETLEQRVKYVLS